MILDKIALDALKTTEIKLVINANKVKGGSGNASQPQASHTRPLTGMYNGA